MKYHLRKLLCTTVLLFASITVNAIPFQYSGTSTVGAGSILADYFGSGTVLTTLINFDVSTGSASAAQISNASGSVRWNDGIADRLFTITSGIKRSLTFNGDIGLEFGGFGAPIINGLRLDHFDLTPNIGVNPFVNNDEFANFLPTAPISFGAGVQQGILVRNRNFGSSTGTIIQQPVSVPEPSSWTLFGLGLLGLVLFSARRYSLIRVNDELRLSLKQSSYSSL